MAQYQDIYYPASGYGQQSPYYDDELLFDGTYQVISVTIDSTCTDDENPEGTTILRPGLLLTKVVGDSSGKYFTLSTADGYLNGDIPTHRMEEVVVLGNKVYMTKEFIMGGTRARTVAAVDKVVPAYLSCNIFTNRIWYNNKSSTTINVYQWSSCQRIRLVPPGSNRLFSDKLRALLYNRIEETVTENFL